ncbi:MAG: zinc metalloprotease, partial [Sphingomonadales bacterium CG_4_10_14_3_um_filter_58_15]
KAEGNALQVRMELQADCYAGVWAAQNADRMEPGDVEEGLNAAHAIGDDTLMRGAGQRPVESMFTHGSSEQRMAWLRKGLQTGDPASCDTFARGAV